MKKFTDIFIFQILNWTGGFAWFYTFIRLDRSGGFAEIAGAELMFGFVGAFLTNLSLRLHGDIVYRITEKKLILLRFVFIIPVALASLFDYIQATYVFAILGFACTPAHLPMRFGFRHSTMWPLLLRLPVAALIWWHGGIYFNSIQVAALYFAPAVLYGLVAYSVYFPKTSIEVKKVSLRDGTEIFDLKTGLQLCVTILSNTMQAHIVQSIVQRKPELAIFERLLRSAFSFSFPYLIRAKFLTKEKRITAGLGVLAVVILCFPSARYNYYPIIVILPFTGDIYTSIVAGHFRMMDFIILVSFSILIFMLRAYG